MKRLIAAILIGVVTWIAVATVLNLGLRLGWPEYAAVEKAMTFTLPMMTARLLESAIAALAWMARWQVSPQGKGKRLRLAGSGGSLLEGKRQNGAAPGR